MAMRYDKQNRYFDIGEPFDGVVFNAESPMFDKPLDNLLASIIYTADSGSILGTIVNGNWIIKNHSHINEKNIRAKFRNAMKSLTL
jgi:formimidoylglutamate deiminase